MYKNPSPQPKHTPWLRKRCQIFVAKDAPSIERDTSSVPMSKLALVPNLSFENAIAGEAKRDCEIDIPPIKAYSSWVAFGNVEWERK